MGDANPPAAGERDQTILDLAGAGVFGRRVQAVVARAAAPPPVNVGQAPPVNISATPPNVGPARSSTPAAEDGFFVKHRKKLMIAGAAVAGLGLVVLLLHRRSA